MNSHEHPDGLAEIVRTSLGRYWFLDGRPNFDDEHAAAGHILRSPNGSFEIRVLADADIDPFARLKDLLPDAVVAATPDSGVLFLPVASLGGTANFGGFRASFRSFSAPAIIWNPGDRAWQLSRQGSVSSRGTCLEAQGRSTASTRRPIQSQNPTWNCLRHSLRACKVELNRSRSPARTAARGDAASNACLIRDVGTPVPMHCSIAIPAVTIRTRSHQPICSSSSSR